MTRYNNHRMGWIVKFALALFVLFGTSQSYAACSQSDLTGIWYFNGVTGDTFNGRFAETNFCKIKVNSNGNIVDSASQCKFRDFDGKHNLDIQGGNLALNSSCRITGRFKSCDGEGCIFMNVDNARLDKGKTVITMVGRVSVNLDVVVFLTGVKR